MLRIASLIWLLSCVVAQAQLTGFSPADPFVLTNIFGEVRYCSANGLTPRSQAINPAIKTLVLIVPGQSNRGNTVTNLYTPTNTAVIDNFSICDGASYPISGPLIGPAVEDSIFKPGNLAAYVADTLITNARFDKVILVPIAVSTTFIAQRGTGNLSNQTCVAIKRLAQRGIVPGMTGVTFAIDFGIGESDGNGGTSSASFQASFASWLANAQACGFSGRVFMPTETWLSGVTSATIQGAQAAVRDGITTFNGGNLDTLNNTNRSDTSHFNNTGAAAAAVLIDAAMHASGAPF